MDAKMQSLQVNDWIDDHLPRSVVRDITATISLAKQDSCRCKTRLISKHVPRGSHAPSDGNHRRMLHHQHPMRSPRRPTLNEGRVTGALHFKRIGVGHAPQLFHHKFWRRAFHEFEA